MSARSQTTRTSQSKQGPTVLGRSAATGRVVLEPASKPGKISLQDARAAVTALKSGSKK